MRRLVVVVVVAVAGFSLMSAAVAYSGGSAGKGWRDFARAGSSTTSQSPGPISSTHKVVRNVLYANGIGNVRFGASPADVRAAVDPLLEQPGGAYTRGGSCRVSHKITWLDQWTGSGEPALTVYFGRSGFAGYQFGAFNPTSPSRNPLGGWVLATARGLKVGDTLARGRSLYGRAFTISTAQGGSWAARVRGGLIKGYASGVPGHGGQILVATIDSGDVGCPAVSP